MTSRFIRVAAIMAVFSGMLMAAPAQAEIRPGTAAPDFTVKDTDGNEVNLVSLQGKTVVLEWSNYSCPYVRKHYDSKNMQSLQETYGGKGVVWLTVMSSAPGKEGYVKPEDQAASNTKNGNKATHVLLDYDGTVGKLYSAKTTPHMFVIDSAGIVQYNGAIDSDTSSDPEAVDGATPYVANAIDAVLAGKAPNPAATQPYGCGVKYAD